MKEGDIFSIKHSETGFTVFKILKIDDFPEIKGGWLVYHLRVYRRVPQKPAPEDISKLEVRAGSSPLDGKQMEEQGEFICHQPVTKEELEPFLFHLKHADFTRYLQETNQDIKQVVAQAKKIYQEGCRLSDEGRWPEAMVAYSQAVEIFPFFVEALDNRGFTRMELGDYRAAIGDFEMAINAQRNIPPQEHDPTSLFSLGECHHRLGDLEKARTIFKQFLERWPDNPTIRAYLPMHPELGLGPAAKKPWWKIW